MTSRHGAGFLQLTRRSLKSIAAATPGVVPLVRILANQYWGLRLRIPGSRCDVDGVTHGVLRTGESVAYLREVFEDYMQIGALQESDLDGARVLELGPGDSLGVALLFVGAGAASVVCLDRFLTARDPVKERQILRTLVDAAAPAARARMRSCLGPDGDILEPRIRYVHGLPIERATPATLGDPFDYVVSRSVLEHVCDLDATYENLRRLLKQGGRMIHKVDLSNHSKVERHPLRFLTYSSRLWRLMSSNISRINRCRWPQHRDALQGKGFVIERFVPTRAYGLEVIRALRARLAPPYSEMTDEELAVGGFFIACRAIEPPHGSKAAMA